MAGQELSGRVNMPVGKEFRYSGGGTTVEQLIIEDITGSLFHEAADRLLFQPLGMTRSSYENPLPGAVGNIAKAHNRSGAPVALPRGYQSMPEAAASGLWTTPTDLSKVMIMLMQAYKGDHDYLSQRMVNDMMTPVDPSNYGLGPRIRKRNEGHLFTHGGANDSYRAEFMGALDKENGVIIFTNGTAGSELIDELLPLFESVLF
ncbi:serine hydrolase domain-containing protein [Ekhidna sp. To15]|uniref:serine hydrolase domain-containing protein n=1 Tax=Ekhidna sp. To15 TaxID=3395267 RepID=UPI003F52256F